MFGLLKKIFPLKVGSMETLINVLQREGCKLVLIEASASKFSIKFSSVTSTGRKVICHCHYCESCLPKESGERLIRAIEIIYPLAESKVSELKKNMKDVKVDLVTA